ncbi:hypothetical protein CLV51_10622 [Chitinophaga niastensis]|uniref:SprT-like family protein n=1 Tax=Chitinophaga niastensis TaxID=536980 RepID=A0A2P8HD68_CHINA|nr:hypothetical protein [Chitinophaga niastensis]PSL44157.1 hypothetical protein CLV51_10622 [Chitinophaga niastensis]
MNNLKGGIFDGRYSIILHEFYGDKANSTISFSEGIVQNGDDAHTDGTSSGIYAYGDTKINNVTLKNASQEYLVATMMHETLHAYFIAHPPSPIITDRNSRDHNQMANDYVCIIADALSELFPNLQYNDAISLSWGGLGYTSAYTALSKGAKDTIESTNINFKMGLNGTKCN